MLVEVALAVRVAEEVLRVVAEVWINGREEVIAVALYNKSACTTARSKGEVAMADKEFFKLEESFETKRRAVGSYDDSQESDLRRALPTVSGRSRLVNERTPEPYACSMLPNLWTIIKCPH